MGGGRSGPDAGRCGHGRAEEDFGMGGRHCGENAGVQGDKEGYGISRYSRVRKVGFGVGDRTSSDAATGREAGYCEVRQNGLGAASRVKWRMEGSARAVERGA